MVTILEEMQSAAKKGLIGSQAFKYITQPQPEIPKTTNDTVLPGQKVITKTPTPTTGSSNNLLNNLNKINPQFKKFLNIPQPSTPSETTTSNTILPGQKPAPKPKQTPPAPIIWHDRPPPEPKKIDETATFNIGGKNMTFIEIKQQYPEAKYSTNAEGKPMVSIPITYPKKLVEFWEKRAENKAMGKLKHEYITTGQIPPEYLSQIESQIPPEYQAEFTAHPNLKALWEEIGYEKFLKIKSNVKVGGRTTSEKFLDLNTAYNNYLQSESVVSVVTPPSPAEQIKQDYSGQSEPVRVVRNVIATFLSAPQRMVEAISTDITNVIHGGHTGEGATMLAEGGLQADRMDMPSTQVAEWEYTIKQEPNPIMKWIKVQIPTYEYIILPVVGGAAFKLIDVAGVTATGTLAGTTISGLKNVTQFGLIPVAMGTELGMTAAQTGLTSKETVKSVFTNIYMLGVGIESYRMTDVSGFNAWESNVKTNLSIGYGKMKEVIPVSIKQPVGGIKDVVGAKLAREYGGFVRGETEVGVKDIYYNRVENLSDMYFEANRPRVTDWSKTDNPPEPLIKAVIENKVEKPLFDTAPYEKIDFDIIGDTVVKTTTSMIGSEQKLELTFEDYYGKFKHKFDIEKTNIAMTYPTNKSLTDIGLAKNLFEESLKSLSIEGYDSGKWTRIERNPMTLREFGERASLQSVKQEIMFDVIGQKNINEALKYMSIEGYDPNKWKLSFRKNEFATFGRTKEELDVISRRPTSPKEKVNFKKYYNRENEFFYRMSPEGSSGKTNYWSNILINRMNTNLRTNENIRFGVISGLATNVSTDVQQGMGTRMGEINIDKLGVGSLSAIRTDISVEAQHDIDITGVSSLSGTAQVSLLDTLQRNELEQQYKLELVQVTEIRPMIELNSKIDLDFNRDTNIERTPWKPGFPGWFLSKDDYTKKKKKHKTEFTLGKKGFNVFVKARHYYKGRKIGEGIYQKVNIQPLAERAALSLMGTKLKMSAAATGKIVPTATNVVSETESGFQWSSIAGEFYPKGEGVYIQKKQYRMGTKQEHKEITGIRFSSGKKPMLLFSKRGKGLKI